MDKTIPTPDEKAAIEVATAHKEEQRLSSEKFDRKDLNTPIGKPEIDPSALAIVARNRAADLDAAKRELDQAAAAREQLINSGEANAIVMMNVKSSSDKPASSKDSKPGRQQIENEDSLAYLNRHESTPVPSTISERYRQDGKSFYNKEGQDSRPAFTDRGDKLTSGRSDEQTAHDMVTIAKTRGWKQIELKGDNEFKRAAWVAAEAHGIQTKGYEPSLKDIEEAAHRRSIVEGRETSNITAPTGPAPAALAEKLKNESEEVKEAGIRALAKAVSRELLQDPKLRARFETVVEEHLKARVEAGEKLPQVHLRSVRGRENEERDSRDSEAVR